MSVVVCLASFLVYYLGYRFYGKRMARNVFQLDENATTPAHELRDDHDYVPARKYVLFGHHYASIAGLSPMLGPAIAVMWGWVPALIWVVTGTIFIGATHDFSALVISMRARGKSIGKVAESIIGPRAKGLFLVLIFFLISLAMGVFVQVVAQLLSPDLYPEAVFPTFSLMVLATVMGYLFYKKGLPLGPLTAVGFLLTLGAIYLGLVLPAPQVQPDGWKYIMLVYAFFASVLPVWLLLQPRDFLNSLLLYLGLGSIFVGFLMLRPDFVAPALNTSPQGAPPLYPFVFIVIACGAISGFHALVSSGTTAKQINKETDAPFIGYGGMIGESLLGLGAVLACTTGFASIDAWQAHYSDWTTAGLLGNTMSAFIDGSALFLSQFGVSRSAGQAFITLVAVSFAMTTLDSATRLLRYNIEEISHSLNVPLVGNRYLASLLAVVAIGFFAFYRIDGQPAGLALWALFGTTNQIMGGLTLLTVTLYLIHRKANYWYTLVPMLFMLTTTLAAMALNIRTFVEQENYLLLAVGLSLFGLAIWMIVEGALRFSSLKTESVAGSEGAAMLPE